MIEDNLSTESPEGFKFENYEQEKRFYETRYDVLNDRRWCYSHGIDYVNPNVRLATKYLYDELFSKEGNVA